ncbi:MAG TPA: hypothetical protein PK513_08905, partial [Alphaproteobacteria bacterium]|nr:hypothetical protein [Alphaproteobacteria bacterium]
KSYAAIDPKDLPDLLRAIAIPAKLALYFPYREYKKSLKTEDFKQARSKCWRMSNAALSFFGQITQVAMHLSEEKIKEIVRNHFEKRLLDASEEYYFHTSLVRNDPVEGFSPGVIKHMKGESEKLLSHYDSLKASHDYDDEQESIAQEILKFENIDSEANKTEFFQLCLELVRAHYEAERINHAYLHAQEHEGKITDPYFEGCSNFFEQRAPEIFFEYRGKPYYRATASSTLEDAYILFSKSGTISSSLYNPFHSTYFLSWTLLWLLKTCMLKNATPVRIPFLPNCLN